MPDNQSAVPVSQRAREAAMTYLGGDQLVEPEEIELAECFARFERECTAELDALRAALEQPWSWPCPEGGAHCCCECDDCCDCDRPRSITPDWQNAGTCIENVLECYATDSVSDADGPVDTVVNSGDLFVILSLAGAAFRARASLTDAINRGEG